MGKFASDARELLSLAEGMNDIAALTHRIPRMRSALADPGIAGISMDEAKATP